MGATIGWFLKTILKARINGDYRRTPFFKNGTPIAIPHVMSSEERANAMLAAGALATMRLPSLKFLKTFQVAARLQSFKAAAEELFVTPSAISHQIKALEGQLGVSLFQRGVRTLDA